MSFKYVQFVVEEGRCKGVLTGGYSASGGQGDINVVVINANQMSGFQNHGSYRSYYNSGYIHEDQNVRLALPAGSYFLIFNNRSSLLTAKTVDAHFELSYE